MSDSDEHHLTIPDDWPGDIALPVGFQLSQYNYIPGGVQLVMLGYKQTQELIDYYTAMMQDWQMFHSKQLETKLKVSENWALGFSNANQVLLVTITQTQVNDDGIPNQESIVCLQYINADYPTNKSETGGVVLPRVKLPSNWPVEVVLPPEAELLTCGMLSTTTFQATLQGIQTPTQYSEFFINAHPGWQILQNIADEREISGQKRSSMFLQMQHEDLVMQITGGRTMGSDVYTSFMILIAKSN